MTPKIPIVVVDDEPGMCSIIERILTGAGYAVIPFTDSCEAAQFIRQTRPSLVLTDVKMPNVSGLDILDLTLHGNPDAAVIVSTAFGSIEDCVTAMQKGAFHYLTKPWQMDELLDAVKRATEQTGVNRVFKGTLQVLMPQDHNGEHMGIAGASEAIELVRQRIMRAAPTDMTVLVVGETGTGKELVARAIHSLSARKSRRFVPINCANLSASLLESELFGYEKGAFTGAEKQKIGLVELANGGTLFLDEIGEMSRELQARLLRMLQEREVQRVGGHTPIPVDLRVVAATNRNLRQEVASGRFREDLYHRLNGISIKVPPLRERREDIMILANLFLEKAAAKNNLGTLRLSDEAIEYLMKYQYSGNVRELQNMIERATVLCTGNVVLPKDMTQEHSSYNIAAVTTADLARKSDGNTSSQNLPRVQVKGTGEQEGETDYRKARESWELNFFKRLIRSAQGNMSKAARLAGMSRRNLYDKIDKLGLKVEDRDDEQKK